MTQEFRELRDMTQELMFGALHDVTQELMFREPQDVTREFLAVVALWTSVEFPAQDKKRVAAHCSMQRGCVTRHDVTVKHKVFRRNSVHVTSIKPCQQKSFARSADADRRF